MAIGLWSMSEVVPLHVISWSRDFTWNGLILGISRDHGMKITWNHVIFTWNQVPGISWFHVMRIFVKFRCTSQRVCPTVPGVPDQTKIFRIRTEPKRTQTGPDSDPDRIRTRPGPDPHRTESLVQFWTEPSYLGNGWFNLPEILTVRLFLNYTTTSRVRSKL